MKNNIKLCLALYVMLANHILKAEWKRDNSTPLPYGYATAIIDSSVRYALGAPYIYKTYDGGLHWQKDSLNLKITKFRWTSYQSLTFLDANAGFIQCTVGDSNFIFTTTDAGYSWNRKFAGTLMPTERVKFVSKNEWVALSSCSVRSSSDEGLHWNVVALPGKDSSLFDLEVMKDDKWLLVMANSIYSSNDKGIAWSKIADLNLYADIDSMFYAHMNYVGMGETSYGVKLLFNVYYAGCGSYYHHSLIYSIDRQTHGWETKRAQFSFNSTPSDILYVNDTGYITTILGDIYKCTDRKESWYRIFKMDCYKDGYLQGIVLKDGVLYAYTSMGKLISNSTPAEDKNLKVGSKVSASQKVLLFPNPGRDQVTVRMPEVDHSLYTLCIFDITGKVVLKLSFHNEGDVPLALTDIAGGQYFYSISTSKTNYNGTITILE